MQPTDLISQVGFRVSTWSTKAVEEERACIPKRPPSPGRARKRDRNYANQALQARDRAFFDRSHCRHWRGIAQELLAHGSLGSNPSDRVRQTETVRRT